MLLSLYIHIPFCMKKCNYCDFLSFSCDEQKRDAYIQALLMEIRSYRGTELSGREIGTIYIGGGTPSICKGSDIARILEEIKTTFNFIKEDVEISMECNPGTGSREDFLACKKAGVNRVSIGLQATDNRLLQYLGRIHTYEQFLSTYRLWQEVGVDNINIDLMAALPGQSPEEYENGLHKIIELNPSHISSYGLMIEPGTPFYKYYVTDPEDLTEADYEKKGYLPLAKEELQVKMYEMTQRILTENGFNRYEISNYAKEGRECQHNLVYWNRGDYLGLGLGASSLYKNRRVKNKCDLDAYIATFTGGEIQPRCFAEEIEEIDEKGQMEEFMFLGLRLTKGVSRQRFKQTFGMDMTEVYGDVIDKFIRQNLLAWKWENQEEYLAFTPEGMIVSDYVLPDFMFE